MTTAQLESKPKKKLRRYRLMAGLHVEGSNIKLGPDGQPEKPRKTYRSGDIIETTTDLCRLNGPGPMTPKFLLVGSAEDTRAQEEKESQELLKDEVTEEEEFSAVDDDSIDTLSAMNLRELRQFAESEEIDLEGLTKKVEIVKAIRETMA